jgi:hypothetical protein
MQTRYLPFIVLCISICSPLGQLSRNAQAQANWDLPEFVQATEAYRRGDCQTAWELMWPLAKAGRFEAIYFLRSTLVGRMVPPGRTKWNPARVTWHELTLAAYTAAGPKGPNPFQGDPNHRWARKEIPRLLAQLDRSEPAQRVAQCYEADASFEQCLNLALATNIIPRFEDYAAEVDAEVRETGNRASCLPRH